MWNGASVGRGVAIIVVAGTVLGVAYNGAGLMGRPARGLPWLAQKQEALPELDTLATQAPPADSAGRAPAGGSAAAATRPDATPPRVSAPAGTPATGVPATPRPGGGPVTGPPKRPGPAPASAPAAPDPSPAAAGGASTSASHATTPAAPAPAAPFIPDSDQPVSVRIAAVKALFDAGAALFLDARDPEEYEAGHIPGALRVTHMDLLSEPERLKTLPAGGKPIVAYCSGGACEASHDLARVLAENGYRKVLVYTGGFPEWAAAGHPVERGSGGK